MADYKEYRAGILEVLSQLERKEEGKEIEFTRPLETIIQLRIGLIRDLPNLNYLEQQSINFQFDQLDRLFANRFEQDRMVICDNIAKEYREDE
jgi:hypothetical protein